MSLTEAIEAITSKALSPVELTTSFLGRIAQCDGAVGAYVSVFAEQALREARQAEAELIAGQKRGALHGIPLALKDLFDMAGTATTASSKIRSTHIAAKDSDVTAALRKAGAIIIGKTHAHEFAFGATTPQTGNPWRLTHTPGGSSGGSAAAVAYGGALAAMGTDTGGSIRIPAALCGVVGLKPTSGLVHLGGVVPLSPSLDHAGPITHTVADQVPILDVIATSRPNGQSFGAKLGMELAGLRVGIPSNYFFERVDPEIEQGVRAHIRALENVGIELVELAVPLTEAILPTQWGIVMAEAASVHADQIRKTPELYSEDVRNWLEAGSLLPAEDYLKARKVQVALRRAWVTLFEHVDVLVVPSTPRVAAARDQDTFQWPDGHEESVTEAYVRLNGFANLAGLPALSIPAGFHSSGLPYGLQLMGSPHSEPSLIQIGQAIEQSQNGRFTLATPEGTA